MTQKYQNAVVIMRAQPLHNAHVELITAAANIADNVIILLGSSKQPRTIKNPFTFGERCDMILSSINVDHTIKIHIKPLIDIPYNDQLWAVNVQNIVQECSAVGKTCLIGHTKGPETYYLKLFPQWEFAEFNNVKNQLNATDIRELYFKRQYNNDYLKCVIPSPVLSYMDDFSKTTEYIHIVEEKEFIETYKKQFSGIQYPITFVTVDNLVIQSGHILMTTRTSFPGKNLLSLPGGFIHPDEFMIDSAIKHLKEKTKIKVPVPVLKGNIKNTQIFDAPNRSFRGRTITNCVHIVLPDGPLAIIKSMDAAWIPISGLKSEECFEDHYSIAKMLLGQ